MIIQRAEQLSNILERRFKSSETPYSLSSSLHLDLLVAFHDEAHFEPETFKNYAPLEILEYLEATHRYYLSEALHKINYAIGELSQTSEDLTGLQLILQPIFSHFERDLVEHMALEEQQLFPYVRALVSTSSPEELENSFQLESFVHDHDDNCEKILEELILYLDKRIKDYPKCFPLTMLRNHLDFFRRDLIVHSLMEEEVLVPMAMTLKSELPRNGQA